MDKDIGVSTNGKYNRKRKKGQRKRTNINVNGWSRRRTRDGISSPGTTAKQPRQDARVIIDSDGDQSDYKVRPANTRALILSAGTTHDHILKLFQNLQYNYNTKKMQNARGEPDMLFG